MKQIVSNYSYSPATNVVTLTGVNIDADQLLLIVAPGVGRTMYNFASVTGVVSAGADTRVTLNASTAGLTTTSPLVIFYDDQASTQTVAGTVTANVKGIWSGDSNLYDLPVLPSGEFGNGTRIPVSIVDSQGNTIGIGADGADRFLVDANITNTVTIGSLPNSLSIVNSSSVTKANVQYTAIAGSINSSDGASSYTMRPVAVNSSGQIYIDANPAGQSVFSNDGTSHIFVKPTPNTSVTIGSLPAISGTVTANVGKVGYDGGNDTNYFPIAFVDSPGGALIQVSQDSNAGLPISGTVTAAAPNGSLTTRFGTPTTANTAFATSAVTNASRKYLLIQNVTTGSNVITVGIGFTPTTTQGIQLTAGAGITFESSYIPTGAVQILSSVTASNFTILEA